MSIPGLYRNYTTASAIPPYRLVKHGASGDAVLATAATDHLIGAVQNMGSIGSRVDVCVAGIPEVTLGGTVEAGDPLTAGPEGKAVKAGKPGTGETVYVIGFAETAGVADDVIAFQYSLFTMMG